MKKDMNIDNLVNNRELSKKLNYILRELNMNKAEFLRECQKYNPNMSKPTIISMFKEDSDSRPSITTLATIIKVCESSHNKRLANISFDYLLGNDKQEFVNNTCLSDDAINHLYNLNKSVNPDIDISIVNDFIVNADANYWNFLYMKKCLKESEIIIKNLLNKRSYTKEYAQKLNRLIYLIDNNLIHEYLAKYFPNIESIIKNIVKLVKWEDVKLINESLKELVEVLFIFVKFVDSTLYDLTEKLYAKIANLNCLL